MSEDKASIDLSQLNPNPIKVTYQARPMHLNVDVLESKDERIESHEVNERDLDKKTIISHLDYDILESLTNREDTEESGKVIISGFLYMKQDMEGVIGFVDCKVELTNRVLYVKGSKEDKSIRIDCIDNAEWVEIEKFKSLVCFRVVYNSFEEIVFASKSMGISTKWVNTIRSALYSK